MAPNLFSEDSDEIKHRHISSKKGEPTEGSLTTLQDNPKEILCDGWYYDVTDFIKVHPGGSIIDYYTKPGEDATAAIQQFHHRSTSKVNKIMKSLKRRPADNPFLDDKAKVERHQALTKDFTKLYLELEKEGMFQPSYTHVASRFIEIVTMAYMGYYILSVSNLLPVKMFGCLLLGLAQGRNWHFVHEGKHYSLTGSNKADNILAAVSAGVGLGWSATWWGKSHNRHHAMPQRVKHDVDMNSLPFFVQNVKCIEDLSNFKSNLLIRFQKYLVFPITSFLIILWWLLYPNPKWALKHREYLEIFCICLRYYLFVNYIGFWGWFFSVWIMAVYFFINVLLGHTHLPITTEPTHWVEHSFMHTANVLKAPGIDWWMGGLNYQIEHHLFPTMPQFRLGKIAERVKAIADKHGMPYHVLSYKDAVMATLNNYGEVADELQHMKY